MSTPAETTIETWMLLLIRACKKNKYSTRTLRRIYAASRALPLSLTPIEYVTHGLMEIIVKYNLVRDWHDFIIRVDRRRTGFWYMACNDPEKYKMPFNEAYLQECASMIAITAVAKFPGYRSPAWFANKYPVTEPV